MVRSRYRIFGCLELAFLPFQFKAQYLVFILKKITKEKLLENTDKVLCNSQKKLLMKGFDWYISFVNYYFKRVGYWANGIIINNLCIIF